LRAATYKVKSAHRNERTWTILLECVDHHLPCGSIVRSSGGRTSLRASGTFHGSSRDRGRGQTCHPTPRFSGDKTVFGRRALRRVSIDVAPCVPWPIRCFVTPLIHVPQVFPGRLARTRPNVHVRGILQGGVVVLVARTRLVHRPTHCNALRVDGA
jgi:hypothetical protein